MAVDWNVEYQDPHSTFGAGGREVHVVDVHFVITSEPALGERGFISVEESRYGPDIVKSLIDDRVAAIKAVHSL